jgi:hypothetical protein
MRISWPFILLTLSLPAQAEAPWTTDWPDESLDDPLERARSVNEGGLVLIPDPPAEPGLHAHTRLLIDEASLAGGWVGMRQCYRGLDAVGNSEVRYRYARMQGLRVERAEGIDRAWVEGDSVQLRGVSAGARLCVRAEVDVLHETPGGYRLRNGPYHRQFLDGYYPMRVTLELRYPPSRLRLLEARPAAQPGLAQRREAGRIELDAWFEGRLEFELEFGRFDP